MIILHFHLQPRFKNEFFHIYFTPDYQLCVESQQLLDINVATKLLCYLLIHQGSQHKDANTAADAVRTSAGAKSQNHLNKSTVYM